MRKLFLILKSYFPTKLPVGLTAFNKWADDVITITGPMADADSMKFALASQVIHIDFKKDAIPMQFFVRCLRKSAANQVASQVFQDIKQRQQEAQKAAADEAAKQLQTPDATVISELPNVSPVL